MAKLNFIYFLLIFCGIFSACGQQEEIIVLPEENETETQVIESIKTPKPPKEQTEPTNSVSIQEKDNIIEFYQSFETKNSETDCEGEMQTLDLSNSSGAMISAYSTDVSSYNLFFRVQENGKLGEWISMKLNDHVENPNRKVWNPVQLNPSVEKIQFKSSVPTNSEVVFRVFKFAKK